MGQVVTHVAHEAAHEEDRSGQYDRGFVAAVLFIEGFGHPTSEQIRQAERTLEVFKALATARR